MKQMTNLTIKDNMKMSFQGLSCRNNVVHTALIFNIKVITKPEDQNRPKVFSQQLWFEC